MGWENGAICLDKCLGTQIRFMGTLMPREIDPGVGTLENLDEGNGPLISLRIIRDVSDGLTGMMERE